MKKMSTVDWLAWTLVVVGALYWGFVGLAKLNLVEAVLGGAPALVNLVYVLVGLSGLYQLWFVVGKAK